MLRTSTPGVAVRGDCLFIRWTKVVTSRRVHRDPARHSAGAGRRRMAIARVLNPPTETMPVVVKKHVIYDG